MKAWLTEIQEGPGLSHIGERVKEKFLPGMVKQSALLGLKAASILTEVRSDLTNLEIGTEFQRLVWRKNMPFEHKVELR